jgi:hypothetical protein
VRLKAQASTRAAPVAVATDGEVMDLAICTRRRNFKRVDLLVECSR